jgi:hypothetical protein
MAWYYWLWVITSVLFFLRLFFLFGRATTDLSGKISLGGVIGFTIAIVMMVIATTLWPLWLMYLFFRHVRHHD